MTDITISGKVAEQLQHGAQSQNRTFEEFLEDVLKSYIQNESDSDKGSPGSLKRMAWVARKFPIEVPDTDVAERSREILRDEYAACLLRRQQKSND